MAIVKITVTNDDGTTQEFVQAQAVASPPTVSVPIGTPVVLTAQIPTP